MTVMSWFALLFIIMVSLPFVISYVYYKTKEGKPFFINQKKKRDARYFGKSFREKIDNAEIFKDKKIIKIRDEEKYYTESDLKNINGEVTGLILGFDGVILISDNITKISKEIYGKNDIRFKGKNKISCRAVCSDRDILIDKPFSLDRWMDACGEIIINEKSELGINVTSTKCIYIKGESTFRRLSAPVIKIGKIKARKEEKVNFEKKNCVSNNEIVIEENSYIDGDIRSGKNILIKENSIITGNVFADGEIVISDKAVIKGNIFTQESVTLGKDVIVGEEGDIVSIVARRDISFNDGDVLYGAASCEGLGRVF